MSESPVIQSPCVACCRLNSDKLCVGCYRHITEIVDWNRRPDAENFAILQKVAQRKAVALQNPVDISTTTAITQAEWQRAKIQIRSESKLE